MEERYARHYALDGFGKEAQQKLASANVLLVGCGGLGCPAAIYLVSNGIGKLTIVDPDVVSMSNLHRQVLYNESDVGHSKAETAAAKLRDMNSEVQIASIRDFVEVANVRDLVRSHDVVIDASDNFRTRYLLNDACVLERRVLVYGAVDGFEGQVSIFNVPNEDGSRGPNYRDLFPDPPKPGTVQNCAEGGVMGAIPGLIGQLEAIEVIKYLTGTGELLTGRLLIYDMRDAETRSIKYSSRPDVQITELSPIEGYAAQCMDREITWQELSEWPQGSFDLIDVREEDEHERMNAGGLNIPIGELDNYLKDRTGSSRIVFYCRSGMRSAQALEEAQRMGLDTFHVRGGINSFEF